MCSISHGIQFANTLENNSCLVSRLHLRGVEKSSYFTLHAITGIILNRDFTYKASFVEKLDGDKMFKYVQEALKLTFNSEPPESQINAYYSYIRAHKNNSQILKTIPLGLTVLANYQKLLKDHYDWEDSFLDATWYLKNNKTDSLYKFPYKNIILVQPQLLQRESNKNAREFFITLRNWMEEYTQCNAFLVNDFGYIFKFQNGAFESYGHISNLYLKGSIPFENPEQHNLHFAL